MYIGQSKNIEDRWRKHCYNKKNSYIDDAIRKYGKENFDFQIICELEQDDDLLNAMEKYYIWKYNTFEDKKHYNLTPGGDFNPMNDHDIKEKHAQIMKSNEVRNKISKVNSGVNHPCYGRKRSQKTKNKISKARLGKKLPDKQKISISKTLNTSGYYRVTKQNRKDCRQGFVWAYQYYVGKKQKAIVSVDIKKLEEKVRAKGLKWLKID